MRRWLLAGLAPLAFAAPSRAQEDHVHAPAPVDPHAGHAMHQPAPAGPHAGHDMSSAVEGTPAPGKAPPAPADRAADRFHAAEAMAAARAQLAREHGGGTSWKIMVSAAEVHPKGGADGYEWQGEAWYGADLNRFVVKTEGEGAASGDLHSAEVQALYARAISPYFDLQLGLRHDLEPNPSRTHAVFGVEGLAPYWFEVGAAAFLSEEGDLLARLEGSYDLRLTQRLILEPRVELNLAAQDVSELGLGKGVTDGEFGLRLRYQIRPELGPYVGVVHVRKYGRTADLARGAGDEVEATSAVVGVRGWF